MQDLVSAKKTTIEEKKYLDIDSLKANDTIRIQPFVTSLLGDTEGISNQILGLITGDSRLYRKRNILKCMQEPVIEKIIQNDVETEPITVIKDNNVNINLDGNETTDNSLDKQMNMNMMPETDNYNFDDNDYNQNNYFDNSLNDDNIVTRLPVKSEGLVE